MDEREDLPLVRPEEAIAFFKAKGYKFGFDWRDVRDREHAKAFTVAKAMTLDLLQAIRAALEDALEQGTTFADFRKRMTPELQARGWWGRKPMIDPVTAERRTVQLGSPRRLRVIFETNMRTAYQAGRWERIQRTKDAFPFLRYVSVLDGRERPEHHAWHGTILPADDDWWLTHYGPCDWGCRCTATPLNQRMIDRRGWRATGEPRRFPAERYENKRTGEISEIERGIGPGWAYNVGEAYLDGAAPPPLPGGGAITASAPPPEIGGFLDGFGLGAAGGVWRDAQGWPLAICAGWFREADGGWRAPEAVPAALVGRALREAASIDWAWVRDGDGRPLLFRRYRATIDGRDITVDVGRIGWRARFDAPGGAIAASYDPRQPRGKDGRWQSSAAAWADGAIEPGVGKRPPLDIAPPNRLVVTRLTELGLKSQARSISLDHDLVRHIIKRHGRDGRGQRAIDADDIGRAASILNGAKLINHGNPRRSRSGSPRIFATAAIGKWRYAAAFEVRKFRIVLASLRKR